MIKMIAATSLNGVIGKNNTLPWDGEKYKADMQFFRKMTANSIIIYGRGTFESFNSKSLPKRRNIVITRSKIDGIETYSSIEEAIKQINMTITHPIDIWLIGGFNIYREGLVKYASELYLTLIPEVIEGDNLTFFPWINPKMFVIADYLNLEDGVQVAKYIRI